MSTCGVMSVEYNQGNWILPQEIVDLGSTKPAYASLTEANFSETVSSFGISIQRVFDSKSGLEICILSVPKDLAALDQTEGILSDLTRQYEEQGIEPVDLVKRAWKNSEENDSESTA